MNLSRKSFLSSVAALFSGLVPAWARGARKLETFTVQIERVTESEFRAILKTSGWPKCKIAVIESGFNPVPQFAHLALMESIQRAMHLHLFPEDEGLKWVGHVETMVNVNGKTYMTYDRQFVKIEDVKTDRRDGIRGDIAASVANIFKS